MVFLLFDADLYTIGMAMRRLSIIDLSGKTHKNDDGSIVIVFNGEIYNYKQLKVNLENRGVFLKNRIQVILRLYEAWY
jgi:asparagine synthase (glutamine-hydrolysing)